MISGVCSGPQLPGMVFMRSKEADQQAWARAILAIWWPKAAYGPLVQKWKGFRVWPSPPSPPKKQRTVLIADDLLGSRTCAWPSSKCWGDQDQKASGGWGADSWRKALISLILLFTSPLEPLSIPNISKALLHNTFTLIKKSQILNRINMGKGLRQALNTKGCSNGLETWKAAHHQRVREMHIKTTMCCDDILSRMAKIKPLKISMVGEAVE